MGSASVCAGGRARGRPVLSAAVVWAAAFACAETARGAASEQPTDRRSRPTTSHPDQWAVPGSRPNRRSSPHGSRHPFEPVAQREGSYYMRRSEPRTGVKRGVSRRPARSLYWQQMVSTTNLCSTRATRAVDGLPERRVVTLDARRGVAKPGYRAAFGVPRSAVRIRPPRPRRNKKTSAKLDGVLTDISTSFGGLRPGARAGARGQAASTKRSSPAAFPARNYA
jgi:hypothetical protein